MMTPGFSSMALKCQLMHWKTPESSRMNKSWNWKVEIQKAKLKVSFLYQGYFIIRYGGLIERVPDGQTDNQKYYK